MEHLESVLGKSDAVEQIWVYGNSLESSLVAVAVPKSKWLEDWAKSAGIDGGFKELVKKSEVSAS